MAKQSFINLFETLDEAMFLDYSPYSKINQLDAIQLLPNNPMPYIQATEYVNGVEVEDWTASIVKVCDGSETDITAYFEVLDVFFDDNGANQIYWQIQNVPFDYGQDLVYLKITQFDKTYYSNPFKLTNQDSEYTSRIDYRDDEEDIMQSIQLAIFYRELMVETEQETYTQVNTGIKRTTTTQNSKYKKFISLYLQKEVIINLVDLFAYNTFVYVNLQRVNLYNPIEIGELPEQFNSEKIVVNLSYIGGTYDPLYVPPTPLPDFSFQDFNPNDFSTT